MPIRTSTRLLGGDARPDFADGPWLPLAIHDHCPQPQPEQTGTLNLADLDWTKMCWPRVSQDRARAPPSQHGLSRSLTHDKAYSQEPPMKAPLGNSPCSPQGGTVQTQRPNAQVNSRHLLHRVPRHLGSELAPGNTTVWGQARGRRGSRTGLLASRPRGEGAGKELMGAAAEGAWSAAFGVTRRWVRILSADSNLLDQGAVAGLLRPAFLTQNAWLG